MPRSTWSFSSAGRLIFGLGAVRDLPAAIRRLGVQRPMIITDPPLVRAGVLDRVRGPLLEAGLSCELFDDGEPEPSVACAERAVSAAREARPDALIGLGGGSNIDLAKIVAAVLTHGGGCLDYINYDKVPGPVLPLVAVPTTSGTGSEVSHAAVLTDTANHMKVSTLSAWLRPALAVVDPELTLSCPRQTTADSGIDALTHAIEAFTATHWPDLDAAPGGFAAYEGKSPIPDALAERAIRLIARHLRTAVHEPQNIEARTGMALAATTAGLAFSNAAVALVHAMEYPLGGAVHVTHGAGNGLLLPHVMRYLLPVRTAEYARVAELLGEEIAGVTPETAAGRAIEAVERLCDEIGIPRRIRDLGGRENQLAGFAERAFAIKRLMALTPCPVTAEDILRVYRAAW